jgi:hypothetical protein
VSFSAGSVFAQSPTFVRTDYPFLGNNHIVADFNGDGNLDLVVTANDPLAHRRRKEFPARRLRRRAPRRLTSSTWSP